MAPKNRKNWRQGHSPLPSTFPWWGETATHTPLFECLPPHQDSGYAGVQHVFRFSEVYKAVCENYLLFPFVNFSFCGTADRSDWLYKWSERYWHSSLGLPDVHVQSSVSVICWSSSFSWKCLSGMIWWWLMLTKCKRKLTFF